MKTFKELKNDVYEIAQAKFGQLTDDVRLRLDLELNAIEQYGRAELLVVLWWLFMDLSEKGIGVKLRPLDGYSVSLVSYLLGISLFNPMEHPNIITERYVLNTLRQVSRVDLRIDVNKPEMIAQLVYDYSYEYIRDSLLKIHTLKVKSQHEESADFSLTYEYRPNSCRLQRASHEMKPDSFFNIPYDDIETFESINELYLHGITTKCYPPITLEALRLIRPTSLSELTEALAFKSENQYDDLMEYLSNRLHENFISTGRYEVDEMLSHTHGVVLFSRQRTECLMWTNRSNWSDEDEWQTYKERVKQLLKAGHAEYKCDVYLEAHNLYKLAYIRLHYPEHYLKILNIVLIDAGQACVSNQQHEIIF